MAERLQQETIPLRKISDFKSKLTGGGARPNLFEVVLAFPTAVSPVNENEVLQKSRFLVKAAALPASTIAPIDIPFRGRILKIAGDRTFETWTITVMNDTNTGSNTCRTVELNFRLSLPQIKIRIGCRGVNFAVVLDCVHGCRNCSQHSHRQFP